MLREELEKGLGQSVTHEQAEMANRVYSHYNRFEDKQTFYRFIVGKGWQGVELLAKGLDEWEAAEEARTKAFKAWEEASAKADELAILYGIA